jgi:small subunit ribosomal protein S1
MASDDMSLDPKLDAVEQPGEIEEDATGAAIAEGFETAPPIHDAPAVEEELSDIPSAESVPLATEDEEETSGATEAAAKDAALSDEELFLAALNDLDTHSAEDDFLFTPLRRGQIIKGTIARITDTEILVDIGTKSEGLVSGRELENLDREQLASLEVGQEINVYVLNPEDRNGHAVLSLKRAFEEQDWVDAEAYLKSGETYESKITGHNKGGLLVRFGKVRGFVPASQISPDRRRRAAGEGPENNWAELVGEPITVKVIEVDRGRNRLILSERAAYREIRAARKSGLLDQLAVGQVILGRVVRLTDFGAFVDIGGIDGLVHLSELSWKHVAHPKEVLRTGQEIEVEVINVDRERQRIGLSYKKRLPDPWDVLSKDYHAGQLVQVTVTKLTNFGAFARLVDRPEIEGLIHISELSERRVKHPREVVAEGDVLTVRILRIEPDSRRLGLSLKQVDSEEFMEDDWQELLEASSTDEVEEIVEPDEAAVEEPETETVVSEAADGAGETPDEDSSLSEADPDTGEE